MRTWFLFVQFSPKNVLISCITQIFIYLNLNIYYTLYNHFYQQSGSLSKSQCILGPETSIHKKINITCNNRCNLIHRSPVSPCHLTRWNQGPSEKQQNRVVPTPAPTWRRAQAERARPSPPAFSDLSANHMFILVVFIKLQKVGSGPLTLTSQW